MSAQVTREGRCARAHCRGRGGFFRERGVSEVRAMCDSDCVAEAGPRCNSRTIFKAATHLSKHVVSVLEGTHRFLVCQRQRTVRENRPVR